jgi:hypothetical protein
MFRARIIAVNNAKDETEKRLAEIKAKHDEERVQAELAAGAIIHLRTANLKFLLKTFVHYLNNFRSGKESSRRIETRARRFETTSRGKYSIFFFHYQRNPNKSE